MGFIFSMENFVGFCLVVFSCRKFYEVFSFSENFKFYGGLDLKGFEIWVQ